MLNFDNHSNTVYKVLPGPALSSSDRLHLRLLWPAPLCHGVHQPTPLYKTSWNSSSHWYISSSARLFVFCTRYLRSFQWHISLLFWTTAGTQYSVSAYTLLCLVFLTLVFYLYLGVLILICEWFTEHFNSNETRLGSFRIELHLNWNIRNLNFPLLLW